MVIMILMMIKAALSTRILAIDLLHILLLLLLAIIIIITMNWTMLHSARTTSHSAPSIRSPRFSQTRASSPASCAPLCHLDCPATAVPSWTVYCSFRPDFDSRTFDILNIYHNATYLEFRGIDMINYPLAQFIHGEISTLTLWYRVQGLCTVNVIGPVTLVAVDHLLLILLLLTALAPFAIHALPLVLECSLRHLRGHFNATGVGCTANKQRSNYYYLFAH